jgi:ketosteroid isomerase-like protein
MCAKYSSVERPLKVYETALNASDAAAVMDLYGANPVFMPQNAPAMVGRDAVRKAYGHVFSTIRLSVSFTIHEVETMGDTAWGRTTSQGRVRILAIGKEVAESNNELYIFKREDGGWKMHRYLFAEAIPSPS